jgi:hypothetical protein
MTNRAKVRRIAYTAFWLLLLIFVELFYDPTETSDSEAIRSMLFGFVAMLAAPASLIILVAWTGFVLLLQLFDSSALIDLTNTVLGSKEAFRLQYLLWWLLMFAASYWQWFYLLPKLLHALRRKSGHDPKTSTEASRS